MNKRHIIKYNSLIMVGLVWIICGLYLSLATASECPRDNIDQYIISNQIILKNEPNNTQAMLNLASCFLRRNNFPTTKKYLEKVLKINEFSNDALMLRAEIHKRNNAWKLAEQDYRKVLELSPGYAPAYLEISNVYMALGDTTGADQAFEQYKILANIETK